MFYSHFVDYGYSCPIDTLMPFYGLLLVEKCSFIFSLIPVHCLSICVCVCVCVYVCVAGHQPVECVQIMRWWISNLGHGPLWSLDSVINCYILVYLTIPSISSWFLISFWGGGDSVSWWSQNILNWFKEIPQYFAPILWSMYTVVLWGLCYFYGWILVQLHQFLFTRDSDSRSWWS